MKAIKYIGLVIFLIGLSIFTALPLLGTFKLESDTLNTIVKDKKINTSSLLGYYAEVQIVNNSATEAELFSVGTEVFESSK